MIKRRSIIVLIAFVAISIIGILFITSINNNEVVASGETWYLDFNYEINGTNDAIILTKYVGTESGTNIENLTIPATATIGENHYNVILRNTPFIEDGVPYSNLFFNIHNTLKTLTIEDNVKFESGDYLFAGLDNMETLNLGLVDISNVASLHYTFGGCAKLQTVDVSHLDTSAIESMQGMFQGCLEINNLDVSNFNTSNVYNMGFMFYNCKALESIDVSHFDTAMVEDMGDMFYGCEKLESLDVSNFETPLVYDMSNMFAFCKSLKELDLSNFNTDNVITMKAMFSNCNNIKSLNLSSFNTSKIASSKQFSDSSWYADIKDMFLNCSLLRTISFGPNFQFKTCDEATGANITNLDSNIGNIISLNDGNSSAPFIGKWLNTEGQYYNVDEIPSNVATTYIWGWGTQGLESASYDIGLYIKRIQPNTTFAEFKTNITTDYEYLVKDEDGNVIGDEDLVKTGMKLVLTEYDVYYYLVVVGDVNHDGLATLRDIFDINKYRLGKSEFDEIDLYAGDANNDLNVDINDIERINRYRLNELEEF